MYQKKLEKDIRCPLEYGLDIFGGKWKSRIICVLAAKEVLRYSQLRHGVEYQLTEKGKSVVPILQSICQWAGAYHKQEVTHTWAHCQKCDYPEKDA